METGTKFKFELGGRIESLRNERKETQQQLGDALGKKREVINSWEQGKNQIKAGDLLALAKHFDASTDFLVGNADMRSPEENVQITVCTTGLAEQAVSVLKSMSESDKTTLSRLLCEPDFILSLRSVTEWRYDKTENESRPLDPDDLFDSIYIAAVRHTERGPMKTIPRDKYQQLLLEEAKTLFGKAAEKIETDPQEVYGIPDDEDEQE